MFQDLYATNMSVVIGEHNIKDDNTGDPKRNSRIILDKFGPLFTDKKKATNETPETHEHW